MRWVLLWVVLVLGAAGVLGLLGRSLWRKAKALTVELTEATDRMAAVAASISELSEQAGGLVGEDDGWLREEGSPGVPHSRPGRGGRRRA